VCEELDELISPARDGDPPLGSNTPWPHFGLYERDNKQKPFYMPPEFVIGGVPGRKFVNDRTRPMSECLNALGQADTLLGMNCTERLLERLLGLGTH
jgi:hypothetical protein